MTDEGMRLLREALAAVEEIHTDQCSAWCGYRELRQQIKTYLARPEPQGETPETDAADDKTMRFSARHERLKDLCKSLERRLREAEGQTAFWKERSMSADAEMNHYKQRAEAAERGIQKHYANRKGKA